MTTEVDIQERRNSVVAEALTWVGTPFAWGQCVKGVGVDCGRFLAAVGNASGVKQIDMESFPQISPQWFLHRSDEAFLNQVRRFAVEYELVPGRVPLPADIVLAQFGRDYAHSAFVIAWPKIIGCASGHCVTPWQDIGRSPQYGTRRRRYFDPFHPDAGMARENV